jgi:predicted TPR repeat methyltransferase
MPTTNPDQWLERVFGATGLDDLDALYAEWADTYDTDMLALGYLHPAVIAGLAGRHVADKRSAILDAGAGTGLIGEILGALGYTGLHGVDLSEPMLAKAKARGVYRDLRKAVLGEPLDFADAEMDAIVSTGVFTAGHAPASAFDELVRITKPGGVLIFTMSDVVWTDSGFEAKFREFERESRVRLIDTAGPYRPLPMSLTESDLTTRGLVYRVS